MNWRGEYPIFVPEVASSGAIAVVRSLGRAGYPVHAVCDDADAVGLHSRYAGHRAIHPPYESDEYLPWLRDYLRQKEIKAIVPSEGFWLATWGHGEEFRALCPDVRSLDRVYLCISKCSVADRWQSHPDPRLRGHLPETWVLRKGEDLPESLRRWREYPLYLKVDSLHTPSRVAGFVQRIDSATVLEVAVGAALAKAPVCLVQQTVPGRKACYNVLLKDDRVVAETMCLASHENPHSGGLTALRRTWWHDAMAQDARRRVRALGWTGVAMVEYKYEARQDRFWFVELNSRFWAALNLDLMAGVDFPRLQLDSFFRPDPPPYTTTRRPLRCRFTFPADAGYMLSRARDRRVSIVSRVWAVVQFFFLFLDPTLKSDMLFPGDRMLYPRFVGRFVTGLVRRTRPSSAERLA